MAKQFRSADVTVIECEEKRVALLEHCGDPAAIGDTIRRFIAWRRQAGLSPRTSATFNIFHGDPKTTEPHRFRLGLCAETAREILPNEAGIVAARIPGGRCAKLRHIGSDDTLNEAARYLVAEWLPASGEALRDDPLYCERVTFFPDTPEHEAIIDLFLPLLPPDDA